MDSTRGLLHIIWALLLVRAAAASGVACNSTHSDKCSELFYQGSECVDGFCSNPFQKGCLHTLLNHEEVNSTSSLPLSTLAQRLKSSRGIRACNSNDIIGTAAHCQEHKDDLFADYQEIRIAAQGWESGLMAAWLMQILLSEVLQVPTSVESGSPEEDYSFYHPSNSFGYGESNNWKALENAALVAGGDCRRLNTPCAHVIPELWNGQMDAMWGHHKTGDIDAPQALGAIGHQGIFVTRFTAVRDPSLLNLFGLWGEENRHKLAATFHCPTTWQEYCTQVSLNNCSQADDVAERPPESREENERYFVEGLYTGHFRPTNASNCTLHPTTCTGHIADWPPGWDSFLMGQMHHNNIALRSNGKEDTICRGYSYAAVQELWLAANATRSNLVSMWWEPNEIRTQLVGTPAEMQRVSLGTPSQECVNHRMSLYDRCEPIHDKNGNPQPNYGDPRGGCEEPPQMLYKVLSHGFYDAVHGSTRQAAQQSPAYQAISSFGISQLQYEEMLSLWIHRGVDKHGFDPRYAVCRWARDNLAHLEDFVPRSYPRVAQEQNTYRLPLFYVALSLGVLATLYTLVTAALTFRFRTAYSVRSAQVDFLFLVLVGFLMVSLGSILMALPPTDASCVLVEWLLGLGYTMEFVPTIVKIGAINRLVTAAKKMRRIKLTKEQLHGTVLALNGVLLVFLVVYTAVDPPKRESEFELKQETNVQGETIVGVSYYCASDSELWRSAITLWHCLLLLLATVLAFQSRRIKKTAFNESQVLALMIYSHFAFLVGRIAAFLLEDHLSVTDLTGIRSILSSCDTIFAISIYFAPKLVNTEKPNAENNNSYSSNHSSFHHRSTANAASGDVDSHSDGGSSIASSSRGSVASYKGTVQPSSHGHSSVVGGSRKEEEDIDGEIELTKRDLLGRKSSKVNQKRVLRLIESLRKDNQEKQKQIDNLNLAIGSA